MAGFAHARKWLIGVLAAAVMGTTPGAASGDAVTYQGDNAHTGFVSSDMRPPLGRKWVRRDLGTGVGHPLVVDGRVFVWTSDTLHALQAEDGASIWSKPRGDISDITYGQGRLFTVGETSIAALDPATGGPLWTVASPYSADSAIVVDDLLIVASDSLLTAYRWQDGIKLWETFVRRGDGIPASDGERVYVVGACGETTAVHAKLGAELWYQSGSCTGGGGGTPRVHEGLVYSPNGVSPWPILDSFLGDLKGTLPVDQRGFAVAHGRAYSASPEALRVLDLATGTLLWRARGPEEEPYDDEGFRGPPLVVGDHVYVHAHEQVWAYDAATGRRVWKRGRGIVPTEPGGAFAATADRLFVPAMDRLVAFGPGRDAPRVDDPDKMRANAYSFTFAPLSRRVVWPQLVQFDLELEGTFERRRVELQASPFPYRRWSTVRRIWVSSYGEDVRVRPAINTRYRLVDPNTLPVKRSRVRQIFVALTANVRFYAPRPGAVRAIGRFRVPPRLGIGRRKLYIYRFRSRRSRGIRVAALNVRRVNGVGRYKAAGTFRPPRLRRGDLFGWCVPNLPPPGYGRNPVRPPGCGNRRV